MPKATYQLVLEEVTPGPATTLVAVVNNDNTIDIERTSVAHSVLPLLVFRQRLSQMMAFVKAVDDLYSKLA